MSNKLTQTRTIDTELSLKWQLIRERIPLTTIAEAKKVIEKHLKKDDKRRGVYLICRRSKNGLEPLYVGMTERQSFQAEIVNKFNTTEFMEFFKDESHGGIHVVIGDVKKRKRLNRKKAISAYETMLIYHFLVRGYKLKNTQGTRFPKIFFKFSGRPDGLKKVLNHEHEMYPQKFFWTK